MSKDGIMVALAKIKAIHCWARPTSIIEIWSFIRLISYYRHFVEDFYTIATPLARLNLQDVLFIWSEECETSF